MSHNIDMSNGRANIAFLGSRRDIWHHLGTEMKAGMTIEEWQKAAGLDWNAIMVNSFADLSGPEFAHVADKRPLVDNVKHCVRSDTAGMLGVASDGYIPVQPRAVLEWFERYISVDDRFRIDVAGSLKAGKIIWATAIYDGGMTVGGDAHVMRLLMSTTFDGSGATVNKATTTRVVCNNTFDVAMLDKRATIRTRHNTRFNPARVGAELATIAASFDQYKAMGDAMAATHVSEGDISKLFKTVLDIPFDAKQDDVSTRKMNQFAELSQAYTATVAEGTPKGTAWAALNAVTRYVDHDRSTKTGESANETESRFLSAQFGSGAQLKEKAVAFLYETAKDRIGKPDDESAIKSIMAATPFRPTQFN